MIVLRMGTPYKTPSQKGYSIYLTFGKKKIRIPVNPEELEIQYPTGHKTYDVLGIGQVVVPKRPSLKTVSWEGFFPGNTSAPYVNSGAREPGYYVRWFEKAIRGKWRCRLIITRSELYDTNMSCVVSDFQTKEGGGEPEDVYYSVQLTEYRSYAPDTVGLIAEEAPPEGGEQSVQAEAAVESPREVETPVLRVGAPVIVNGEYCYDSYGSKPHGTANNLSAAVTRIVSGNPYPIHVGSHGWVMESQLQITG